MIKYSIQIKKLVHRIEGIILSIVKRDHRNAAERDRIKIDF